MYQYNVPSTPIATLAERGCIDTHCSASACNWSDSKALRYSISNAAKLFEMNDSRIDSWTEILLTQVYARFSANRDTAHKAAKEARVLLRVLRKSGDGTFSSVTPEMVQKWFWRARVGSDRTNRRASAETARNRRWAAKTLLESARLMGLGIDPVELLGPPIAKIESDKSSRPLTGDEARAVRGHADASFARSKMPAIVALGFAGADAAETAAVTPSDIDLDEGWVQLSGPAARRNRLPEWSRETLRVHLLNSKSAPVPNEPLCVGEHLVPERAKHSVTVRLYQIIAKAGLKGIDGVTGTSIRLTTAHEIATEQGIDAAADFLGNESLDRTAAALRWRETGDSDA